MNGIRKALKFRLPSHKSEKYFDWVKEDGKDRHHLLNRHNDYLVVNLSREEHQKRHKKPNSWFEEDLIHALTNLMKYTKHLEEENAKKI